MKSSPCRWIVFTFFLLFALSTQSVFSQDNTGDDGFRRNSVTPDWITPHAISLDAVAPEGETGRDVYFLMADRQMHAELAQHYYRYAYRFLSENGIQENSQLSFNFDPSYEKLTIHTLRIHRNGEVIDKLAGQEFKLLQQETGADRQLYDGRLTAMALIEDVRLNDVLEYAYSLEGENPVFEGHFATALSTRWSSPIKASHLRMLWDGKRGMQVKSHRGAMTPSQRLLGELTEMTLSEDDVPALLIDDAIPGSIHAYPWIQVSDYGSWQGVREWALRQYAEETPLPPELQTEVDRIRLLEGEEEKILAALRWVQDEIRYLGLFEGTHSHKPYPLETILRRRFGDCKDKSSILFRMLRELGFEARLAFVATSLRESIRERLPSPFAFNHVVVLVRHQNRDIWMDATASYQRGPLKNLYFPAYGYALVLDPETTKLTKIEPTGHDVTRMDVSETYDLKDYSGEATLTVISKFYGSQADSMRSSLSSQSLESLQKSYLDHYSAEYPEIKTAKLLSYDDDPKRNIVTVREHYRIQGIWLLDEDSPDSAQMEMYARIVSWEFKTPNSRIRTLPFRVSHPRDVTQRIIVNCPTPINFVSDSTKIKHPAFEFSLEEIASPQSLELVYHYQSKANRVSVGEMPEYLKRVDASENSLSFFIWVPASYLNSTVDEVLAKLKAEPKSSEGDELLLSGLENPAWGIVLITLLGFLIATGASSALYFWNPSPLNAPAAPEPRLVGIRGWLLLVALGVLARPLLTLGNLLMVTFEWDQSTWLSVSDSSHENYNVLWQPGVFFEQLGMAGFLAVDVLILILFFQKRSSLPRLIICYFPALFLFNGASAAIFSEIEGIDAEVLKEYEHGTFQALFATVIWTPYFLISRRVRQTFTVRRFSKRHHHPLAHGHAGSGEKLSSSRLPGSLPEGEISTSLPPPLPPDRTDTPAKD